jgi:hypothetical protein
LALAGCPESTPKLIGGTAVLSDVAHNQAFAAVLVDPRRLSNGTHTGALQVVPVTGGGDPLLLNPLSSGGVFRHGSNLWFLGGVTVVDEGTPVTPHVYGALYLWAFPMEVPVKIGDNVREFYPSRDGSSCVFIDWADKKIDPSNTGTLKALTAASCATGTCVGGVPLTLASGLVAGQATWAISNNGRQVLVAAAGSDPSAPGKAILLGLETGQIQILSTAAGVRSAMISPAGDTAAWVEGDNKLVAVTTADSPPTPRTFTVTAARVDSAQMIDAANYVVSARPAAGDPPALLRVGTSGTTTLGVSNPTDLFVSQSVPGITTQYALYSLAAGAGTEDLYILDLSKTTAQPVQLAQAVAAPLSASIDFSDDGGWLRYLDNIDVGTGLGDAYVAPAATPARNLIANGIRQFTFVPHTTRLLYVSAPSTTTDAGVLTLVPALDEQPVVAGVGVVNFVAPRSAPFRTYLTQQTGGPDDGVWYIPAP